MAKRNTNWSEEKFNRYIREERGQGEGIFYKPWLNIQDFPSQGLATRIMGYKTKRMHNFFSALQLRYFYLLEWEKNVIDIREHFPLLDFDDVVKKKEDLNRKLFTDNESGIPYVICTTFLITYKRPDGEMGLAARSVKGASELEKTSSLEKLEIERRYWQEAKGVDWRIVTNKDISTVRASNIEWLHTALTMEDFQGFVQYELHELSIGLLQRLKDSNKSIRRITSELDKDYSLNSGTGVSILKYLIVNRRVYIDMDKPIDLNIKSSCLKIASENFEGGIKDEVCS